MTGPQPLALLDIVRRGPPPETGESAKIPWDDPEFSARMLAEHLSQQHDMASRRAERIAAHVAWLHAHVLGGRPGRILDLGCGPGLYTARLAALGHRCSGIDFAPAAIAYAREVAAREGLACDYRQEDVRAAELGQGFDLILLLFGEFNAFHPDEARALLGRARAALQPGGRLVVEAHTLGAVEAMGRQPRDWRAQERGLFSARPHLRLDESFWDADRQMATQRYYVVDAATAAVREYLERIQAYGDDDYRRLVEGAGLRLLETLPGFPGDDSDAFVILVAGAP